MADYDDGVKELKQLDDSKTSVKSLVDSGLTSLPRFFIHPPDTLSGLKLSIPVVYISSFESDIHRAALDDEVIRGAKEFVFFQVVNHGTPPEILDRTINVIKVFPKPPPEIRSPFYQR